MIKIFFLIFLSIVNIFASDEDPETTAYLRSKNPLAVFEEHNLGGLTNRYIERIGCGEIWELRASRGDEGDRQTIKAFAKILVRHAYDAKHPLSFSIFKQKWDSANNEQFKMHYGCILGLILSGHLLQNFVSYNEDDYSIMSNLKNEYGDPFLLKLLEFSYDSLDGNEKKNKKTIFDKLKGMIVKKELTRDECYGNLHWSGVKNPEPIRAIEIIKLMPIELLRAYVPVYLKPGAGHSSILAIIDDMPLQDSLFSLRALAVVLSDEITIEDVEKRFTEREIAEIKKVYPDAFNEGTKVHRAFKSFTYERYGALAMRDFNRQIIGGLSGPEYIRSSSCKSTKVGKVEAIKEFLDSVVARYLSEQRRQEASTLVTQLPKPNPNPNTSVLSDFLSFKRSMVPWAPNE